MCAGVDVRRSVWYWRRDIDADPMHVSRTSDTRDEPSRGHFDSSRGRSTKRVDDDRDTNDRFELASKDHPFAFSSSHTWSKVAWHVVPNPVKDRT
jgi:hypothetical protein